MISIQAVLSVLLFIIIAGVIFWLLWWLVGYCGLPQPFDKVARVVLAVCAVFILIAALLSLAGYPVVRVGP